MYILFDNLSATIIASTLFVMLAAMAHRTQQAQVQATGYYMLRQQQVGFVETVRRDVAGIIRVKDTEEGGDQNFRFVTRMGDEKDSTEVTYHREQVGVRDGTPLYQIRRYEGSGTPTTGNDYNGGSMSTVTEWQIFGWNEDANQPADPVNVTQIHVRFAYVLPFKSMKDDGMSLRRWEATFQPRLLQGDTVL